SGRCASMRNTLGTKPALSCTARMRSRRSCGSSSRDSGTGKRLIDAVMRDSFLVIRLMVPTLRAHSARAHAGGTRSVRAAAFPRRAWERSAEPGNDHRSCRSSVVVDAQLHHADLAHAELLH